MISGWTLHHTAFSIKIPSTLVWWGVVYGAASGTLKEVFIDPEGYDSPLAPQGVSVAIAKNPSPTLCSPYDMEHFDEQYYTDLKKQGRFFTVKKTIAGKLVDVTYQKKYYETLFNGWVARYCISDNDMTYGVAIALYERKELDAIVASFRLK